MKTPETLEEYEIYGHNETWNAPLKLFSIGDSNWNLYADKTGTIYSIVKPNIKGCQGTFFGNCQHVKRLMRQGYFKDKLTPYGVALMQKNGLL